MAAATPAPAPASAPSQALSWDDQIVPALRKKLEAESAQLSQRISVLDSSSSSSSRRREDSYSQGWQSVESQQYLASDHQATSSQPRRSPSSVYATPTRRASNRAAANLDSPEMLRAKERARVIRERKMSGIAANSGQAFNGVTNGAEQDAGHASSTRQRTQSTPMKYQNHVQRSQSTSESSFASPSRTKPSPRQLARAKADQVNARDRELDKENDSMSIQPLTSDQTSVSDTRRRVPATNNGLADTPRLPTAGPDNYNRTSGVTRSGSVEPATSLASRVVPTQRSTRAATEPPLGSKNSWDEVLPPAIARRVAQEELLRRDPSLASVEGLIDTWDREGLPLSRKQVDELVESRRQREKREWEERERDRMQVEQREQQREQQQEQQRQTEQPQHQQVQPHSSSSASSPLSHPPLPRLSSTTSSRLQPTRNTTSTSTSSSSRYVTPQPPTTSSSVGATRTLSSSSRGGITTREEDGFEMVQVPRQSSQQRGEQRSQLEEPRGVAQREPQSQNRSHAQNQPQAQQQRPPAHPQEKNEAGCCACTVM